MTICRFPRVAPSATHVHSRLYRHIPRIAHSVKEAVSEGKHRRSLPPGPVKRSYGHIERWTCDRMRHNTHFSSILAVAAICASLATGCYQYRDDDLRAAAAYTEMCRKNNSNLVSVLDFYQRTNSIPDDIHALSVQIHEEWLDHTKEYQSYRDRLPPEIREEIDALRMEIHDNSRKIPPTL